MYWLIVFVSFIILLGLSQLMLHFLKKKGIKINRWLWAVAAFLVVIVPRLIFPTMNQTITQILYIFCGVFALNFMIEQHAWYQKHDTFSKNAKHQQK